MVLQRESNKLDVVSSVGSTPRRFDYDALTPSVAKFLRGQVEKIRRSTSNCIINIGKDLIAAKHFLDHGTFLSWIEADVGISARTAQAYMKVAHWASGKSQAATSLPPTLLYILSAPSTPPEFVAGILCRVEAGEQIGLSKARGELQVLREKIEREPTADRPIAEASSNVTTLRRAQPATRPAEAAYTTTGQPTTRRMVSLIAEGSPRPRGAEHRVPAVATGCVGPGSSEPSSDAQTQRAVIRAVTLLSEELSHDRFAEVRDALTNERAAADPALGRKILVAFSIVQQSRSEDTQLVSRFIGR